MGLNISSQRSFSLSGYKDILLTAKQYGYSFSFFKKKYPNKPIIILRHDVDADPTAALILAELESSFEICSTYFFMVRSPLYNLFSRANDQIVRKIIETGHQIGLHFDGGYLIPNNNIYNQIDKEIKWMEDNYNLTIRAVSFHQPAGMIMNNNFKLKYINTYDEQYMDEFFYLSDANASWKNNNPVEVIQNKKEIKIQLLIHPLWWVAEKFEDTIECWKEAISRNFYREQEQLLATERAYGKKKQIIIK